MNSCQIELSITKSWQICILFAWEQLCAACLNLSGWAVLLRTRSGWVQLCVSVTAEIGLQAIFCHCIGRCFFFFFLVIDSLFCFFFESIYWKCECHFESVSLARKCVINRRQSSSFQESTANPHHICWLQQSLTRFTQHTHCSWAHIVHT